MLAELVQRSISNGDLEATCAEIFNYVQSAGDVGLLHYTRMFDGVSYDSVQAIEVKKSEVETRVDPQLKLAIDNAYQNIYTFHENGIPRAFEVETQSGVVCSTEYRGIQNVGLYIPGGSAPLFSTILMLGVPAKIAGCENVVLCMPSKTGEYAPEILYAAAICGVDRIYPFGGIQAIAAMALGTESIPSVDKIYGPGNRYVTAAKLYAQYKGLVAVDMPAGPSEVLVWADDSANPAFVASDLLAQAEHAADARVVLVCNSDEFANRVQGELEAQMSSLPRLNELSQSMEYASAWVISDVSTALEWINDYAPEHLIIQRSDADSLTDKIINAGSVFVGEFSPESVGDYASGTNHTLPTAGYARAYSGLSVSAFMKSITFQKLTQQGFMDISQTVVQMARAEGLEAHAQSVIVRQNALENGN